VSRGVSSSQAYHRCYQWACYRDRKLYKQEISLQREGADVFDAKGITMTLGFDIRLAWQEAKIGFVFAQRGIVPEAASSFFLPKLIGHSRAMELFMVRLLGTYPFSRQTHVET
jgi:hypothetical protein